MQGHYPMPMLTYILPRVRSLPVNVYKLAQDNNYLCILGHYPGIPLLMYIPPGSLPGSLANNNYVIGTPLSLLHLTGSLPSYFLVYNTEIEAYRDMYTVIPFLNSYLNCSEVHRLTKRKLNISLSSRNLSMRECTLHNMHTRILSSVARRLSSRPLSSNVAVLKS
jgi:hypothetical protein